MWTPYQGNCRCSVFFYSLVDIRHSIRSNDEFIQLRLYWDEEWNGKINKIQFVKVEAMGFYFSISIVRLSLQQQQTMQCAMHFWWPTNHFYRTANSKIILIMSAAQNDIISHTFHTFFSYLNFTLHNWVSSFYEQNLWIVIYRRDFSSKYALKSYRRLSTLPIIVYMITFIM